MSDYLAGMTARAEHKQMNDSRQPVLDFDRRGSVYTPGWLEQAVGMLFQWLRSLQPSLKAKTRPNQTITRELPLSHNG